MWLCSLHSCQHLNADLQVQQAAVVSWVHFTVGSWRQDRFVLQGNKWICTRISNNAWKISPTKRKEGNSTRTKENTRQNDSRGQNIKFVFIACWWVILGQWANKSLKIFMESGSTEGFKSCIEWIYIMNIKWNLNIYLLRLHGSLFSSRPICKYIMKSYKFWRHKVYLANRKCCQIHSKECIASIFDDLTRTGIILITLCHWIYLS